MKERFYKDLLWVALLFIVCMGIWSNASETLTITVLIFFAISIMSINIFFILKREEKVNVVIDMFYSCLFYIVSTIAFSMFVIDDFGYMSGVLLLIVNGIILTLLGALYKSGKILGKYSYKTQKIYLFIFSLLLTLINLIVVSY